MLPHEAVLHCSEVDGEVEEEEEVVTLAHSALEGLVDDATVVTNVVDREVRGSEELLLEATDVVGAALGTKVLGTLVVEGALEEAIVTNVVMVGIVEVADPDVGVTVAVEDAVATVVVCVDAAPVSVWTVRLLMSQ